MSLSTHFSTHPLWERGFRPFFLLAALYAAVSILLWSGFLGNIIGKPSYLTDAVSWHAHEMLYGYTLAVVAGFLLTAVANWTGWSPVRHSHLFGLCLLWLLGRIGMNLPGMPFPLALGLEALFLPALTISLWVPLHKSRNTRNYVFLFLLSGLYGADLAFMMTGELRWLHATLLLILAMISIVGGRVIPAFTVATLRQSGQDVRNHDQPTLDKLALASLILLGGVYLYQGAGPAASALALASALLHALRLRRYHSVKTLSHPLLWILHAGYIWLILGLVLLGFAFADVILLSPALHALTLGCIGSLTLGMMCRVSLGHSGRALVAHRFDVLAFVLLQIATGLRVGGVIFLPDDYLVWIIASGLLWSGAFLLFMLRFLPILLTKHPDR